MLKLVQIWSKANDPMRGSLPYGLTAPLLTVADIKDDEFDANDPDIPEFLRERKKEHQREKEAELEFGRKQSAAEKKEFEKEEKQHRAHEWLASEQYRRALQQLQDEIADTRAVTQRAYDRARQDEEKARQILEAARRNALVVSGSRVYFTRDGSRLYGEDGNEITDRATVEDARRQHRDRPDATTHEDFVDRSTAYDQTAQQSKTLREALNRLDALDKRITEDQISPADLAQARQDKQDIVDSLPQDARQEYQRMQDAKKDGSKPAYIAADPAFASAPGLYEQFRKAGAGRTPPAKEESQPRTASTAPAYKPAPDYSDPQG